MISDIGLKKIADHPLKTPDWKEQMVFERREGNELYTNVPHRVVQHSPYGYEWGYAGSGPSDLALNIVENCLRELGHKGKRVKQFDGTCYAAAIQLHQDFKFEFIATLPREGGSIETATVVMWISERLPTLEEWIEL